MIASDVLLTNTVPETTEHVEKSESLESRLNTQILRIRLEREFERQRHEQVQMLMKSRQEELEKEWDEKWRDFMQNIHPHQYISYVKTKYMPGYLLIQQAKLLRKVHHMCILDNQASLVETQSNDLIKGMKRTCQQISEEKSELEMKLLTSMFQVQKQEMTMHQSYSTILSDQSQELDRLSGGLSTDSIPAVPTEMSDLDNLVKQIRVANWQMQSRDEARLGEKNNALPGGTSKLLLDGATDKNNQGPVLPTKSRKLPVSTRAQNARTLSDLLRLGDDDSSSEDARSITSSKSMWSFSNFHRKDSLHGAA